MKICFTLYYYIKMRKAQIYFISKDEDYKLPCLLDYEDRILNTVEGL